MGLDGVELVMAVEEAFDIQITDADAEKMLTPRQVIDFVLGQIATTTASVCLTQRAFNLLRRAFIQQGYKRPQISPATNLSTALPVKQRRERLQQIMQELGISKPPKLVLSRGISGLMWGSSLAAGVGAAVAAAPQLASLSVWIFIGVAILTAGIAIRLTKPLRREFPRELQTVGDLARWVMTHKPDLATAHVPKWTPDQVEARVREIVVDTLGCKPDFSLDAHFVKDLGLS
jgi:acyl carrier protein